jgi:hypothetical protein
MYPKKSPKISNIFECKFCDYKCSKNSEYSKHLLTLKHQKLLNASKLLENASKLLADYTDTNVSSRFYCQCGKSYSHDSSYYRHRKTCTKQQNEKYSDNEDDEPTNKEIIMLLIKENSELKNMMMKVLENGTHNTTHTNSHNKAFNLNFFLNETCKDAMNISDFVNSIKLNLEDLENTGRQGYIEGISNILLKNLNNLEHHMRPLHCSDLKREVLYIKDNNKWEKESEEKPILTKAIKIVANENIKQIKNWRDKNPDCTDSESKKNNLYLKIVSNSMNGLTEEEGHKNINKIISNVAKEVLIDKN